MNTGFQGGPASPSPSKRKGGMTPSSDARQNVVVIYSTEPQSDAETLMRLFPNKFVLEAYRNTASVVLIEETSDLSTHGGILLIVAPCESSSENPALSETGRALEGTLMLSAKEVSYAASRCGTTGDATLAFTKSLSLESGLAVSAMIRLSGGGSILLLTPEFVSSTEGRLVLAQMLASPDKIQDMENGGTREDAEETFADVKLDTDKENSVAKELVNGNSMMKEESDVPLPKFPSLAVSVMGVKGEMVPNFPLNSRVAVPVETELFVGNLLVIMRPPNPADDPYYNEKIFSKKKRRFICQLQGKFKYVPKGTVYAGGEISEQMKLGLVGKGLCSVLLNLLRSVYSDMHYSFGDSKNVETPHIVFPAWKFFENIVVTKPGETPPQIGEPFEESKASKEARKNSKNAGHWNTEDTYSMSFYSMYLDIPTWHIMKLPVTKDLDLRTFWGNSFLSVVLYEKEDSGEERHIKQYNKYIFAMEMKFLGLHAESEEPEESSEDEDILPWDKSRPLARSSLSFEQLPSPRRLIRENSESFLGEDSDGDDTRFFDAEDVGVSQTVEDDGWFYFDPVQAPVEESKPEMPSVVDILCPAWVEIWCSKGKYTTAYAFNVEHGTETLFRTSSQFGDYFNTDRAKRSIASFCSQRMSSSERARRVMGQTFAHVLTKTNTNTGGRIYQFKALKTELDSIFLKKPRPTVKTSRPVLKSGYVARALSERQWVEEWAILTDRHISFYQPMKQKPIFRMSLKSIVNVRGLSTEESPCFPLHSFMAIETLGRRIYLMFAGEAERNHWVNKLTEIKSSVGRSNQEYFGKLSSSRGSDSKKTSGSDSLLAVDDPTEEFLHKSSMWNCKQRRILNCRKFSFSGIRKNLDPSAAVENALRRALDPVGDSEEGNLCAFLDSAAALKEVDVNQLNEKQKLAFFLNLYHVMIMHAFLVLGTPDSAFKWMSYFNMIAYQCSDDIFSLTELEHNIIRASMNFPSQFISKFVLPKSRFRFALTQADYRINFALNCGSLSNPGTVPIYRAESLDGQLDSAAALYLHVVQVTPKSNGSVVVTLPRVCQWFADDFGDGSNADVIRLILRFLNEEDRKLLLKPLAEGHQSFFFGDLPTKHLPFKLSDVMVKYLPYAFECRHLTLADDFCGSS